ALSNQRSLYRRDRGEFAGNHKTKDLDVVSSAVKAFTQCHHRQANSNRANTEDRRPALIGQP
ncbi:hypothetical protein LR032_04215, partial [Candidatus Bipolaricaulota bacterium]|nr:hypothetical protein [Candidatus Bipolaricaulota bacterium]